MSKSKKMRKKIIRFKKENILNSKRFFFYLFRCYFVILEN